jgi:hypothetical protein
MVGNIGKFPLGQVVITSNASDKIPNEDIKIAVIRHYTGDWGDICKEDKEENDKALIEGNRLLSVYYTKDSIKFWVITEWDRSVTTVLLPEDY